MRKAAEIASAFAPREALDGKISFFLVGIGGAGMSALARMLKHRGFRVRGTDSTASPETARLQSEGIEVHIGHSGEGIQPDDAVVLTDAIDLDNSPEVTRAKELGIPLFRRSQALGWLLKPYKVIAVTGTHGKTTTTGMTGAGLIAAGLDPLVVVGASIPEWGGPVREGKGDWAVVEACEAYDSFHDLDPNVVVLTNLELDHVDFHGNWDNLKRSVNRFVGRANELIYCEDDPGAKELAEDSHVLSTAYGGYLPGMSMSDLPGRHNHLNAFGALLAAKAAGADTEAAAEGIKGFHGAERRLQVLFEDGITVIDDYAHHPTEIEASLKALKERNSTRDPRPETRAPRIIVAFQPHLYSRTSDLIPEFAKALDEADVVFLTDIYPAREAPIPGVSSARIAELVTKECYYVPSRHLLPMKVAAFAEKGDVVVGMGAGNISEFAPAFIKEWERRIAHGSPSQLDPTKYSIAVLYGGDSSEREISILSGREIAASLESQGFKTTLVDVTDLLLQKGDLSGFIGPDRPDLAFLALHGTHAEDGAIQGLLELLHIPYTGSGIQASSLAMDKRLTKEILGKNGVRVPLGQFVGSVETEITIPRPWVVKPNAEGSTVGLSFVEKHEDLQTAIRRALAFGSGCLVEEWITGMETSTPVLGDRALLPVEIAPMSGKYDFESKYTPGATEEIVPARLAQEILDRCQALALQCHRLLGCEGATRTDMIIRNGEPIVLEVNTLPGMTETSLLPNSAKAAGISFHKLTLWLVQDALTRHAKTS
jgi:D-alanine--D-alanine ligase